MTDINIRGKAEVDAIRRSCRCVAGVLGLLKKEIKPGINTKTLDDISREYIVDNGGRPAFMGYKASFAASEFPANICTSINDELVHGIPKKEQILKKGDILSVDVGVEINGFYGDAAYTYIVGDDVDEKTKLLLRATNKALMESIKLATANNHLYDISSRIEEIARESGYKVVRNYTGHGIGTKLHEPPQVPNYGVKGTGPKLRKGMVLAIEPMFIDGDDDLRVLDDGWTVATTKGSICAHFEHTVAIGENGADILTKSDNALSHGEI